MEVTERNEIDAAWAIEAEDRTNAFERGEIKTIPAEKVFAGILEHGCLGVYMR